MISGGSPSPASILSQLHPVAMTTKKLAVLFFVFMSSARPTSADPTYIGSSGTGGHVGVKHYGSYKQNTISLYHDAHRRRCVEKSLEAREASADVVFTGTVRDLLPMAEDDHRGDGLMRARVEVKRVMKGASVLTRVATGWTADQHGSRRLVVDVKGIGDRTICNSDARINDTRIFLAGKTSTGDLRLNSSLVRISIDNIEQAEAAVNGYRTSLEQAEAAVNGNVISPVKQSWTGRKDLSASEIVADAFHHKPSSHDSGEHSVKIAMKTTKSTAAPSTPTVPKTTEEKAMRYVTTKVAPTKKAIPMTSPKPKTSVTTRSTKAVKTTVSRGHTAHSRTSTHPVTMPTDDDKQHVMKTTTGVTSFLPSVDPVENADAVDVTMPTDDDYTSTVTHAIAFSTDVYVVENERGDPVAMPTEVVMMTSPPNDIKIHKEPVYNGPVGDLTRNHTPCDSVHCLFGAECFTSPGSPPSCRCPESHLCAGGSGSDVTASSRVVCGTDSVTYASECHLRAASCMLQSYIAIQLYGPCDNKVQETIEIDKSISKSSTAEFDDGNSFTISRDPCDGHSCSFGARCVSSADGRSARCQCEMQCNEAITGNDVTVMPVCGDDGIDYPSECEMRRRACIEMRNVTKKYDGKCDPCDGIECAVAQVCQLDSARRPVCRCGGSGAGGVCPMEFDPVCASDGATYSNECVMSATACRKRRPDVRVMYRGECSSGRNPCSRPAVCPGVGEECSVDRDGAARCVCIQPCPAVMSPVCGTDGRTYDSVCSLERDACLNKRTVTVSQTGVCNGSGACLHHKCEHGASCVVKDNKPQCLCPMCSNELHPVCGNDGKTYENECKLRIFNCEKQLNTAILHHGACNACAEKKCGFFSNCETDEKGVGKCVCPTGCVQVENKVCGSDGVTYTNECELRIASCRHQRIISVESRGACDLCTGVKCRYGARCENGRCVCQNECPAVSAQSGDVTTTMAVCGSDGVSYSSECTLLRTSCTRGVEVTMLHAGMCEEFSTGSGSGAMPVACDSTTCKYGGRCQTDKDGSGFCSCNFNCDALRSRVCGTDGVTYGNDCQMREEACRKQTEIRSQPMDNCEEMDEELCDGNPALRNPATGKEYNCNPGQDTCPAASYCHKVMNSARCCREDIRTCDDTPYGCCPDGLTASLGPNNAGCPNVCQCNPLGSYGVTCDPVTRQCTCKPGVGGLRCDRCEPNYWGLPKIAEGNSGCLPCNCNSLGSLREDCDQNTGRCMCRPGVAGQKCNICPNGKHLSHTGCTDHQIQARACSDHRCRFGAVCHVTNGIPDCVCPVACQDSDVTGNDATPLVCGSDSKTYGSACQLKLFSCRLQRDITIAHYGPCPDGSTMTPVTSTTPLATSVMTKQHRRTTSQRLRITKHLTDPTQMATSYGVIGDFCLDDSYCFVTNSFCNNGVCACQSKLLPTNDNTVCSEETITVPSFSGDSFIQLKKLKHGNRDVTIEMNFKPMRKDGVLIYAAQTFDGRGDYIAVSLSNGFLEFRYDLGSGSALLKSTEKVELNKFHKVTVRRFGKDGMLRLDDRVEVSGTSPGMLQSLNIETPLFLGFVPNATTLLMRNIGVTTGFIGCIEMLKVNSSEMSLTYDLTQRNSPYIEHQANIKECDKSLCMDQPCMNEGTCVENHDGVSFTCLCSNRYAGILCENEIIEENLCNPNPCQAGGSCIALAEGGFICKCTTDRDGELCEKIDQVAIAIPAITIPQFHGDSFLTLKLSKAASRSLSFEIWFLPYEPNGVLVYSSQEDVERGDFIVLNIINERLQLSYNLGSGRANITSSNRIRLNVWNKVVVSRMKRFGMLSLNDATPAKGRSSGLLEELNLPMKLYVGGSPSGRYHPDCGAVTGLRGAIQRFYKDGQLIEDLVGSSIERHHVTDYDGLPCPVDRNPCRHNGRCLPRLNDFECQCLDGFTGRLCQYSASKRSVAFNGHTHHRYLNAVVHSTKSQTSNRFEIRFQSQTKNGLLLLQSKMKSVDGDYLAIALNDGHPEISFNLGKEHAADLLVLVSKVNVSDGQWHTLLFNREKRIAQMSVDQETPLATIVSSPEATTLDTDGYLWIGGHPSPPRGLPDSYYSGFEGCIEYARVDDEPLDLVSDRNSKEEVEFCR